MRIVIWLILLFVLAVVTASTLGTNDGLVSFYWRAWRLDMSLNLFLLALVLTCALSWHVAAGNVILEHLDNVRSRTVELRKDISEAELAFAADERIRRAGAETVVDAQEREWGGYTGYFVDPDGFRWEIAYNPGDIGQDVLP